jgi:hypothetical protein
MRTAPTVSGERVVLARRSARERILLVGIGAFVAASITGIAGASGPATTAVSFTKLNPPFTLMTNTGIGASQVLTRVVSGAATPIPSNSSTIELTITASGPQNGRLDIYPAGNPQGGSGQFLAWTPKLKMTKIVQENVGINDSLTFASHGTGVATVSATITGYSTQVTAGDINGSGGNAGQVLTNNGFGGVAWQTPTPARLAITDLPTMIFNNTLIESLRVPQGTWLVTTTGSAWGAGVGFFFRCQLLSPLGQQIDFQDIAVSPEILTGAVSMQGLLATPGGDVQLRCDRGGRTDVGPEIREASIAALQVGSASGDVVNDYDLITPG